LKTAETQLAFADLLNDKQALQRELNALIDKATEAASEDGAAQPEKKTRKGGGRRDLSESSLPRTYVEIPDPRYEGKYRRAGFDTSYQVYRQRAEFAVLVRQTVKYEVTSEQGTSVLSAEQPKALVERSLLHTSAIADIMYTKFGLGTPLCCQESLYRQEADYKSQDMALDRSLMCRYLEEAGNAFGATVVHAMWEDAVAHAGVISTDATGAMVQPEPTKSGVRQSCHKGHFFTAVADDAAILFRYVPKHNHATVSALFGKFRGFLQADASNVYDVLDRAAPDDRGKVTLVGCWAHCRRYFFEAALCRHAAGVEGLMRIRAMYAVDTVVMKAPPSKRAALRQERVLPLMNDFFEWVRTEARVLPGRSLVTTALGYAVNQEQELRAVLQDVHLPLDNTRSERALRKVVVGRKNWMFYGSDAHAESAAATFALIATCRLHHVEPRQYLDELMRVLPYWPRERYLELAPQHWARTRARLNPNELAALVSRFTVPPPE
jgi:transposase